MNPTLRRLTSALPVTAPAELRREWSSIIVHQNMCAVPAPELSIGSAYWQRGCLLLMLDDHGKTTHIAKLRPTGEPNTAYEGRILSLLWEVEEVRPHIPASHWAAVEGAQILLTAWVPGEPYLRRVRQLDAGTWARDMRDLIRITRMISGHASQRLAELHTSTGQLHLAREVRPLLTSIAAIGIGGNDIAVLTSFLDEAGAVPGSPQHGDLWPGNILRDGTRWRLVDFEMFGKVRSPLFDTLHLLRTSLVARSSKGGEAWLLHAEAGQQQATQALQLLVSAGQEGGLGLTKITACFAHYLIVIAHRFSEASLPVEMARPILEDLRVLIAGWRAGRPIPASLIAASSS